MKSFNRFNTLLLCLSLGLVIGFSSCKKDKDEEKPFVTNASKFSDPAYVPLSSSFSNSTNPDAQQALSYAQMIKSQLQAYSSFFNIPADASYSAGKVLGVWTWNYQGYTAEYMVEEVGSRYLFTYTWTYLGSPYYGFTGWEETSGNAGHLEMNFVDANELYTIDWTNNSGNFVIDMKLADAGVVYSRYVGTYNANGSGNVKFYDDGDLYYEALWNTDGSGTATTYNSDGTVEDTYSWS
ncbi:hypothetical protein BH09BAC1_BH09BAC1_20870 [soil metagenome]